MEGVGSGTDTCATCGAGRRPLPGFWGARPAPPSPSVAQTRARREGWGRHPRRVRGKVRPRFWNPEACAPLYGDRKEDQRADLGVQAGRGWNSACWGRLGAEWADKDIDP